MENLFFRSQSYYSLFRLSKPITSIRYHLFLFYLFFTLSIILFFNIFVIFHYLYYSFFVTRALLHYSYFIFIFTIFILLYSHTFDPYNFLFLSIYYFRYHPIHFIVIFSCCQLLPFSLSYFMRSLIFLFIEIS
ncbi:hypothetical protein BDC45DRAFT_151083 [Circinella umbellata]|nr:hypothetical protein BDC45DRAFT_151083 [Circinella umbellata]